jgi:hypothetical protein
MPKDVLLGNSVSLHPSGICWWMLLKMSRG